MVVQRNCSLLLNCNQLKDLNDVRADDLGTWNHNGVIKTFLEVVQDPTGRVLDIKKKNRSFNPDEHTRGGFYLIRRIYHRNGTAPDFRRMIVEVEGKCKSLKSL